MERLMKALGDDGLDDFDQAQLSALGGDSEDEEDDQGDEDEDEDEKDVMVSDEDEDGEEEEEEEEEEENTGELEEEAEEEDIALEDAEFVDEDAIAKRKVEIDNGPAMARIRESIQLDPSLPWTETLIMTYPHAIDVDVNDDLNREVAFYKQALQGATDARKLATKHNFPFTRPSDYFAEMVKSDAHMERVRQRLLDESAAIKKSDEKRKEREGKKFGKQVQIEKLKEREKSKKDMEERLKGLKRKRKDILENPDADDDAFDVAVEDAISDRPVKRGRGGAKISRQVRDKKYGFGGAGRRSKQNTKDSTDNFDFGSRKGAGGNARGGRGGARGGRGG
ncbi:eukaryotic rRNA processing, partial [Dendrothele bispora CBS 962.96]